MNLEYKLALISDLIVLAKADEKVTSHEYDFVCRLAERMEVSKETVDELLKKPKPSQPIFSELERITHFHKLLLMMNVDRETHEKEVHVLREFGLKMGIRPAAIDKILLRMNDFEDKLIPAEELISIFQTYYN